MNIYIHMYICIYICKYAYIDDVSMCKIVYVIYVYPYFYIEAGVYDPSKAGSIGGTK